MRQPLTNPLRQRIDLRLVAEALAQRQPPTENDVRQNQSVIGCRLQHQEVLLGGHPAEDALPPLQHVQQTQVALRLGSRFETQRVGKLRAATGQLVLGGADVT